MLAFVCQFQPRCDKVHAILLLMAAEVLDVKILVIMKPFLIDMLCCGPYSLPVPWLLYSLSHGGKAVPVSSNGLFCAIVLLFLMLIFVIVSIAACRWKMSQHLGLSMFLLYFLFLLLSVLLEKRIILCPVSV